MHIITKAGDDNSRPEELHQKHLTDVHKLPSMNTDFLFFMIFLFISPIHVLY
jgi:hypothetical protein